MRVEGSEGCTCVVHRPCRRTDGVVAFRALAVFTDFSGLGGQFPVLTSSSSMNFHNAKQTTSTTTGPTDTSRSPWPVILPRKSTATAITATVFIAPRIKRLVISYIFRTRCGCGRQEYVICLAVQQLDWWFGCEGRYLVSTLPEEQGQPPRRYRRPSKVHESNTRQGPSFQLRSHLLDA